MADPCGAQPTGTAHLEKDPGFRPLAGRTEPAPTNQPPPMLKTCSPLEIWPPRHREAQRILDITRRSIFEVDFEAGSPFRHFGVSVTARNCLRPENADDKWPDLSVGEETQSSMMCSRRLRLSGVDQRTAGEPHGAQRPHCSFRLEPNPSSPHRPMPITRWKQNTESRPAPSTPHNSSSSGPAGLG